MLPDSPLLLFAPGAGAPSSSPWMTRWAMRLAALGPVVRFDYPYMRAGRRAPDRLPALVQAHRAALAAARAAHPGPGAERSAGAARGGSPGRTVLVGKSMGARIGCHLALELAPEEEVAALVCLGYPLRGAGGALRDAVLVALRTPVLFVQGTRDPLCPLDALEQVRRRMRAPSALHVVEGGDHGLLVGRRALRARGLTQEALEARALAAVADFVSGHTR